MDNKATTKRMIGAVVLVLVAALLLAWLLKGKNRDSQTMANQASPETQTILGFPNVTTDATGQKPMLVDGNTGAAEQAANGQPQAGQAANTPDTAASGNSLLPNLNMKLPSIPVNTVANTTGFNVRPAGSEVREVVDTNGKVTQGTGSLGTGDAKASAPAAAAPSSAAATTATKEPAAAAAKGQASASHASAQEKPVAEHEHKSASTAAQAEKKAFKPVLQGEHAVPKPESVENSKAKAAKEAAKDKTAPAGAGTYVIQVAALAEKAKAEALHKSLVADGHAAQVKEAKVDGKTVYRVQIGSYLKKEDALAVQAKMKARYPHNTYLQNSFITSTK